MLSPEWMKKSGRLLQHGRVGAHAAARFVDAPALARGVAGPDEGHRAGVARRRAEAPDLRFARNGRRGQVLKSHAIEDVLTRRETLQQRLCSEVALRQRVDRDRAADVLEAVGGRGLDQHARRPVGARPHHRRIGRDVARLNPVRDLRPAGGVAEIGLGDDSGCCEGCGRCGPGEKFAASEQCARACDHRTSAVNSRRTMPIMFDRDSTLLRRLDDFASRTRER